ncbi:MAG: enoyl-CoA hydratase/isomerase family protein [Planctomycetota bacterium]
MIRVSDEGPVRVVTLNRPEKRNALTPDMLSELAGAFRISHDTRAISCFGRGKSFCAGFDLRSHAPEPAHSVLRAQLEGLSETIVAMRACSAPIVMGIHGAAVAGGCALLGGADVVIAEPDAKLGYPVVKLGLSPAVSGPFLIGSTGGRARGITLDAELVDGRRAAQLGLVHELADDARSAAIRLATRIAKKPGHGAMHTKRWTLDLEGVSDEAVRAGLNASLDSLGPDTVERIQREVFGQ